MTASDAWLNDASCFQFIFRKRTPVVFVHFIQLYHGEQHALVAASRPQENMRRSWNGSACWPFARAAASVPKMKVGDMGKEGIAVIREVP